MKFNLSSTGNITNEADYAAAIDAIKAVEASFDTDGTTYLELNDAIHALLEARLTPDPHGAILIIGVLIERNKLKAMRAHGRGVGYFYLVEYPTERKPECTDTKPSENSESNSKLPTA